MLKRNLFLTLATGLALCASARDYNVEQYGIKGDGITLNTPKIQKLIDDVSKNGGGRIVFPQGTFKTGSVVMKSGVELHFEKGAELSGSTDPGHYHKLTDEINHNVKQDNSMLALIMADGAERIAITGPGTIDGNGRRLALTIDSLLGHRPNELDRPKLLLFRNCKDVHINGMNMRNSACWGLSFELCENMHLDSLNIYNRAYWNNDGIDLSDCHNVEISYCKINSADDGICLKSYHADNCNDGIKVHDCEVRTSASGVKFGTASYGGFRNVDISDITIFDTFRSAIALESVDGGILENVRVKNITAINTGNPIFIRLGHRSGEAPGKVRNIHISDLTVVVPAGVPDAAYDLRGPAIGGTHNPIPSSITGIPGHPVEDVTLERLNIIMPGGASDGVAYLPSNRYNQVGEKIRDYPEFSMFGDLPAWGFFLRHVDGVHFKDVKLSLWNPDYRPPFVMEDAENVTFTNLNLPL